MYIYTYLIQGSVSEIPLNSLYTYYMSRRPLTWLENIGFEYPFYVYDGNRPLAPILNYSKTKMVQSDVCCLLTCLMIVVVGIKIPGIHSRIRTE
jgi:hypothetical protein